MVNNTVAGSERFGYRVVGQSCSVDAADKWSNNVAVGALVGKLNIFFFTMASWFIV